MGPSRYGGRGHGMPAAVRAEIRVRVRRGEPWAQVAAIVGVSKRTVARVIRAARIADGDAGAMWDPWKDRSPRQLSWAERGRISCGLRCGASYRQIAAELGRPASTVSREVNTNGGRERYCPAAADRRAYEQARRPKRSVFEQRPGLRAFVENGLGMRWSPQQIAARLVVEFPDDEEMRVSHETIYQALFVQGRGALRKELAACLRSGRSRRRPQRRSVSGDGRRGPIANKVMISERPAEVEDRAVPGHWEGDLLMGTNNASAIATLVERATRYTMLVALPEGRRAEDVAAALTRQITTLPVQLRRTITWDQGAEMAAHAEFTVATGIDVYFCDPHAPWQRGSNENTNGLLRQYFPKGTDLSGHSQAELNSVAAELNGRPRQTLSWMTPSEAFSQLVAATP
jgi:IS30 family transposase